VPLMVAVIEILLRSALEMGNGCSRVTVAEKRATSGVALILDYVHDILCGLQYMVMHQGCW
jgi:hypothetical protein